MTLGRWNSRISLRHLLILIFSVYSFWFFSGLAGCDTAPSAKDTAGSETGAPVDVSGNIPSPENIPSNPSEGSTPPPTESGTVIDSPVKNVILLVGSGMGPGEVGQVVQYRRLRLPSEEPLALEKLLAKKNLGMVDTHSYLNIVSDTAAANSALACGLKVRNNTVGIDANGNPCQTILEKAAALGKATGLVSNVELSDPGPASYLAHRLASQEQNEIALDILENSNVEVLLSGGMEHLIQSTMKMSDLTECQGLNDSLNGAGLREDSQNLIDAAKGNGYQFACNLDQLNGMEPASEMKLLGIFSNSRFPLSPDRQALSNLPSLAQMTQKALDILSQKSSGFLLVVQDGLTHIAAQDNDAGSLLQEGLDFDKALGVALSFAEDHPDTLLVFTGDHETGGFAFALNGQRGAEMDLSNGDHYQPPFNYAPFLRFDLLADQRRSFFAMTSEVLNKLYGDKPELDLSSAGESLVSAIETSTPYFLGSDEAKGILDRAPGSDNAQTKDFPAFYVNENIHADLLGRAVANQTATVWASGTPTSTPVLVSAMGPEEYAGRVRGFLDNTEIAKIIIDALMGR